MYVHAETLAREADSAHGVLAHVNVRSKTATSLVAVGQRNGRATI